MERYSIFMGFSLINIYKPAIGGTPPDYGNLHMLILRSSWGFRSKKKHGDLQNLVVFDMISASKLGHSVPEPCGFFSWFHGKTWKAAVLFQFHGFWRILGDQWIGVRETLHAWIFEWHMDDYTLYIIYIYINIYIYIDFIMHVNIFYIQCVLYLIYHKISLHSGWIIMIHYPIKLSILK